MLEDMYTRNVYPGSNNTYNLGSDSLNYANGYFNNIVTNNITYNGEYWEEITIPANAVGEGWPSPGASNVQSGFAYLFADEPLAINEKYVHFNIVMPHSWKEGTDIQFNIRWIANSDQVGTRVRWKIAYSWANTDDDFPVSSNIWALSALANNDSLKHQRTDFATVSGVGKKIGSVLLCYVSRNSSDVSDNYTDTAIFVSANVLYQLDAPGSKNEFSK